jgi:hypothetical protein
MERVQIVFRRENHGTEGLKGRLFESPVAGRPVPRSADKSPRMRGVIGPKSVARASKSACGYLISLMTWNIGMYRAMTDAPTKAPMIAISIGSINEVRESTAASTSWS